MSLGKNSGSAAVFMCFKISSHKPPFTNLNQNVRILLCSFRVLYNMCLVLFLDECFNYYHPRMRVGNVFSRVCLSVCLSVCPSVQTITFEPLDIETSFLVCRYILTISRSSLSIKVIGLRSRSYEKKMIILFISTCESSVYGYRSLMRSRLHIKVKVTSRSK